LLAYNEAISIMTGNVTATTQLTAEALKTATTGDDAKSETAQTTTSSSLKRKRGNELKFYAVKAGHKPDIYHSWEDCKFQVTGFKGAVCMYPDGFSSEYIADVGM
jgi:hypothetical protein